MSDSTPYTLFLFTMSPYSKELVTEGYDALFSYAAFEQPVKLLFWGEGALQLYNNQQQDQTKNIEKLLKAFELYEIPSPFVHCDAAEQWLKKHESGAAIEYKTLDNDQCAALIHNATRVHSF